MFELRMSETNTYVAQLKSCQLLLLVRVCGDGGGTLSTDHWQLRRVLLSVVAAADGPS